MNIKIAAKYLLVISKLEEAFGLPTPRDKHQDEIFGPYALTNGDGYMVYDGKRQESSYRDIRKFQLEIASSEDYPDSERSQIAKIIDALRDAVPTFLPTDHKRKSMGMPFIYERWQFAWLFVPELQRWELAPLGIA